MTSEATVKEEMEDLRRRQELQTKLQECIRRSGSPSEIGRIQGEIEALNRKIESHANRSDRRAK